MDRRDFLRILLGGLLALVVPLAAEAQQAGKVPRIGYLARFLQGRGAPRWWAWSVTREGHHRVQLPRLDTQPAHRWLRDMIITVAKSL